MPSLTDFNSYPRDLCFPLLNECLSSERWVSAVLEGRPYATVDDLLATAGRAALDLSDDDVRAAIAGHPRIGQRAKGDGLSAKWSAREQSGVAASLTDRLAAANAAYEDRFGHIYLVCATGLTGEQMLADLAARMDNPPDAELDVARRELAKIAVLRLRKEVR